ncbi:MAG: hypothetical protein HDT14_09275 [Oscillibacter sp.]|nr:hypothetical protein [Oscillibacter sp.]
MRKWAAAFGVAALMAAAFFLPEWLSSLYDRQLLDTPSLQIQDEDREGFAESVQLTVAEKLLLLRSGTMTVMELSQDVTREMDFVLSAGTGLEKNAVLYSAGGETPDAGGTSASDEELDQYRQEISRRWEARLESVQQEIRNLQALGGLPALWKEDGGLTCTGLSELLYMDPDTRMSFQVYRMALTCENYSVHLLVDVQSGRILSFVLQWGRDGCPDWGIRGAAGFGGVWRNYWGLDSVGSGWYNSYTQNILEQTEAVYRGDGDYNANTQISFSYDGQSLAIPLACRAIGGRTFTISWNA